MTIKVIVNGARGRMGQESVKALSNHPGFTLVGESNRGDDLSAMIKKNQAQVVVDLTTANAGFDNTRTILNAGAYAVVGTSGFLPEHIKIIQEDCKRLGIGAIIAPNFSIGTVLMMKYAAEISRYLPYVEIIEYHHDKKADAPSGTAIKTAEMIAAVRTTQPEPIVCKETLEHARGATHQGVPIHSVRLPGLLAHQQVMFGGDHEVLKISHDSFNRACFMPGVILACQKVLGTKELIYGLEYLL